jgi:hypothetical protein
MTDQVGARPAAKHTRRLAERSEASRLALMAALLGMIAPPGQPKSTPAVIAMATIAASRLELLFRVLRYLGGVLSRHQGPCVQRLRSPSPLARCSG